MGAEAGEGGVEFESTVSGVILVFFGYALQCFYKQGGHALNGSDPL